MKVMRVKTPARVIVSELRKSVSTRVCRWLLIASGVVGVLSAGLVAFTGLQGIQAWLTPFASVRNLLSGHMGLNSGPKWPSSCSSGSSRSTLQEYFACSALPKATAVD
jgi:hypothetical protein